MSLSYKPLTPVLIENPITSINDVNKFAVRQGGNKISYKAFSSPAVSSSTISYSCPPPSGSVIINRYIKHTLPIRLTFTGKVYTTNNAYQPPTSLLNAGLDAPRFLPMSSALESLQININNTSVSVAMADTIHALTRYNICSELRRKEYSSTPSYPDCSQNYSDLTGTARNPLGNYGNASDGDAIPRGGFPFTILNNATVVPTTVGVDATATVDFVVTEPLFLSPLYFGSSEDNAQGFYNVNSFDVNMSFLANAGFRLWSHSNLVSTSGPIQVTSIITGIQVSFNGFNAPAFSYPDSIPRLLFEYISPNLLTKQVLSPDLPITYPFNNVTRYPTDIGSVAFGNQPSPISSNNIQLNSIPEKIFIYVRPNNATLQSRCDITDCYLAITNVTIQWANQSTLLSSATQQQLYDMNVKNQSSQDFISWSGKQVFNGAFPPNALSNKYSGVGSVLCLRFGEEIQIESDECPGMRGQYMLQVTASVQNVNNSGAWDNLPLTMYIVAVTSGSFTVVSLGSAQQQEGIVSPEDVLNAQAMPGISSRSIERYGGGDFLSSLGQFANKVNDFLKENKLISSISGLVPHPIGQVVHHISKNLGYGEGGEAVQDSMSGGKSLLKSQLRRL